MIPNWLYRLQLALCLLLFILIVLGAGVRLADAGLACPDWPLCFGKVIPPFNTQIFLEWIHRKLALWVGVLALLIALCCWIKRDLRRAFGWLVGISLVLFLVQAILGKETVTRFLAAHIVSAHLIGGYSLFALHIWIAMKMRRLRESAERPKDLACRIKLFVWIFFAGSFLQTLLGGLVSTNYAGMACGSSFPLCLGQWLPPLEGAIALHFFHRLGGFILLGMGLLGAFWARSLADRCLGRLLQLVLGLICLQVVWGVGMLHSQVHFGLSLAHSATSLLIFTLLAIGSYDVRHR